VRKEGTKGMTKETHQSERTETTVAGSATGHKQRLWLAVLLGGVLFVLVAVNVLVYFTNAKHQTAIPPASASDAPYQGTELGAVPAPNFQLVDQMGAKVALQNLRGHPVVLTFLYTNCPGPCPITAEKLHAAAQELGAQANQIQWLAVSVNPTTDTPRSAAAFVKAHNLTGRLHFLLGSTTQLQPTWKAYNISVQPMQGNRMQMNHSVGVYLINAQGREKTYFSASFTPDLLATDLRVMLKQ